MVNSIHEFDKVLKKYKLLDCGAEVGVAEGRSSQQFMSWGFKKFYLVDMWQHTEQAGDSSNPESWHRANLSNVKRVMEPYEGKVHIMQGESLKMAEKITDKLSFVYLDANHEYSAVLKDLEVWSKKLKKGGILAMHDFNDLYGVKRAATEFCEKEGLELNVLHENGKEENKGAWFKIC